MSRSRSCSVAVLAAVLVAGLFTPAARADDQILDPLPTPTVSGLGLTLKEIATLPRSEPVPPPTDNRLKRWNRINYLGELPDRSGRLYVPDLNGKLYFLKDGKQHVYLDVGAAVGPDFFTHRGLGSGFGFVAFHPRFAANGRFYTIHTEAFGALTSKIPDLAYPATQAAQGVLTEWTAKDPSADIFSGERRELMRLGFEGTLHGIQQIGFNPYARFHDEDYGLLYLAVGDGGVGVKTTVPQDLAWPQGKLLRIDPRGTNSANGKYGIPPQNPFAHRAGALGEVYASGLRDPYRFSWDPAGWKHRMFLGHIGEKVVESVYEVTPGADFGWSEREGPFVHKREDASCGVFPLPPDDAKFGYSYPVAAFDHNRLSTSKPCADSGNALIGGFVYRGHRLNGLHGKYIFGEGVGGAVLYTDTREMKLGGPLPKIRKLMLYDETGKRVSMPEIAGHTRVDLRFGQDQAGELYLMAKANGKIWKVTGTRQFADCHAGHTRVSHAMNAKDWAPVTPSKWRFPGREVVLAEAGVARPGPRRPFEYAVLQKGRVLALPLAALLGVTLAVPAVAVPERFERPGVFPTLSRNLIAYYDFEHPVPGRPSLEADQGRSGTDIALVNGGTEMRVPDGVGSRNSVQVKQVNPAENGTDDWKAGLYSADGVPTLKAFNGAKLLPLGEWVFLAATFDYDNGTMALYRNGKPVEGFYVDQGDPWAVAGEPEPDLTSATDPRGIKIGGSFPQNTRERNPCNCRMDNLMFLDRAAHPLEILLQYHWATKNAQG